MAADGTFSPVGAVERGGAVGPSSNTGQKGGALIDFLTVVFPAALLAEFRVTNVALLVQFLFGTRDELAVGAIRNRKWQFYRQSASIIDREGEQVGKIGIDGNGDTVCVSLSGAGTRWVKDWARARGQIELLRGKLSRCDVAFDDYDGRILDVRALRERARLGDFAQGGRPPKTRFLDDEGHGTGCTLYVGSKGHKQGCFYEKGKQQGIEESPWVRAEVRFYGKHQALPFEMLTDPLRYLRGAYDVLGAMLANVVDDVCTRIKTVRKAVETTGEAMVRWAHRQVGPALNLLREVFGSEWAAFAENRIVREGHPGRFRGVAKGARLVELLRTELCLA